MKAGARQRRGRLGVEGGEQPAQQVVERASVGGAQWLEQALLVGDVRLERTVDEGAARPREPDGRASAVAWVGAALDEARLGEPVEPLGDPAGREHRRFHQIGRA